MTNLLTRFGRSVPKGTVLFREDEAGREMFVLQSGRVQLSKTVRGEDQVIAELGPGEFFGEMSILNEKPRNATATVIEDAQLLALDPKTFEAMIKANTEIAVRMIKKLARRLDESNERIENLLLRDANSRVVHAVLITARSHGQVTERGIVLHLSAADLQKKTGVDLSRIEDVLVRMEKAQLLARAGETLVVPSAEKLDEFLEFLEMRERFGEL